MTDTMHRNAPGPSGTIGTEPYSDHWEHLADELKRLDLLIRMELERIAIADRGKDEVSRTYPGMALTPEEMLRLIEFEPLSNSVMSAHDRMRLLELEEELACISLVIRDRSAASAARGILLPLCRISEMFGLSLFEKDSLLLTLAAHLDPKYEKLYGYMQDNPSRNQPTVDLARRLLSKNDASFQTCLSFFLPSASLRMNRLLELPDSPNEGTNLISMVLKLNDVILQHLLEPAAVPGGLRHCFEWIPGKQEDPILPPDEAYLHHKRLLGQSLARFASSGEDTAQTEPGATLCWHLIGPSGVGRSELAADACRSAGISVLALELANGPDEAEAMPELLLQACRMAAMHSSALIVKHAERLNDSSAGWWLLEEMLGRFRLPLFLVSEWKITPERQRFRIPLIEIELRMPDARRRAALWTAQAGRSGVPADAGLRLQAISEQYRLTPGQIREAELQAARMAEWKRGDAALLTDVELREACRNRQRHRLDDLAARIVPVMTTGQLVLPHDQSSKIRMIVSQMKNRYRVLTEWNFHGKLSRGKGLSVLFSGPPGTGKTMAAEAIAGELGLDLYRIDLSQIISKYIGETEKNLSRLFKEAQNSSAVLFFDEADALFGKRSEVKDSHDRHANTEIAYLLQQMEEYDGMSVLATNLQNNMDEAFARRMAFRIDFPMPDEDFRLRLWHSMLPPEAPRSDDIDFSFLAKRLQVAGGNIKNIVLTAAYMAAEEDSTIRMQHLIRGAKQEYDKLGKLCLRDDFGPYYEWIL